jgi:hypothetical protein
MGEHMVRDAERFFKRPMFGPDVEREHIVSFARSSGRPAGIQGRRARRAAL